MTLGALLVAAALLTSCGGDSVDATASSNPPGSTFTVEEAVTAFEDAAGGYPFEKTTSLVDGAVAYAPRNSADPAEVAPLNDALGEASVAWQVLVFDGEHPPVGERAAREVAFSSKRFDDAGGGVYLGDNAAYVVRGNVVATGPALDEDAAADPTLTGWQGVLADL